MQQFRKYQSVKRSRKWKEIDLFNYLRGSLYVFPKLDGANASIWLDDRGELRYGSRNSDLSIKAEEFRGFRQFVMERKSQFEIILATFNHMTGQSCTIYGEWMVPHTVKNYTEDMWKKFWIFDVAYETPEDEMIYVSYDEQKLVIENKEAYPYLIPPLKIFPYGLEEKDLEGLTELNTFGIQEGTGFGEGVVVKRYYMGFQNWLKVIHADFSNSKQMKAEKAPVDLEKEKQMVDYFMDAGTINKEYAKLMFEDPDMPKGKVIPRLLNQVFTAFVEDNMLAILKKFRNPTINFNGLKKLTDQAVRNLKADLF